MKNEEGRTDGASACLLLASYCLLLYEEEEWKMKHEGRNDETKPQITHIRAAQCRPDFHRIIFPPVYSRILC